MVLAYLAAIGRVEEVVGDAALPEGNRDEIGKGTGG
jgi:hypothetical protein